MTCISAYRDVMGNIYMGGDSIGATDYSYVTMANPKVFFRSNMVMGYTSSFRLGQILQYDFEIPEHPDGMDDMTYLVSIFLKELMKTVEEKKYATIKDNELRGGIFLVGYNKRIYKVESLFNIIETNKNYASCGCGCDFSDAAFWMMDNNPEIPPSEKVYTALKCASSFAYVKPPFSILKLECDRGINKKGKSE